MHPSCCWFKERIAPQECPYVEENDERCLNDPRQRLLHCCLRCPEFYDDLRAQRGAPQDLARISYWLTDEIHRGRQREADLDHQLEVRMQENRFLHEVGLVLQSSVEVDEVIAMALTAITSGKGFGFNRAVLLLIDQQRQMLGGYIAMGPRRPEEAALIWQEIEEHDYTLKEMAALFFEKKMQLEREKFRDLLEILSIPLDRRDHFFIQVMEQRASVHVDNLWEVPGLDREQAEALGVSEMVIVPLLSHSGRVGLLLADNIINRQPISQQDRYSLETFALPVSFAIERAGLHKALQRELDRVSEANTLLRQQQEQILKMEKMALVGNLAANIAHSLRNPLTIIGGFARNLAKRIPAADPLNRFSASILRETVRIEESLQEMLAYSESLHPSLDLWDLNKMAEEVTSELAADFSRSEVRCQLNLWPALPPVRVDYKLMGYCLRTLLRQMLEGLPHGGQIDISTTLEGEQVELSLVDDGPGSNLALPREISMATIASGDRGRILGLSLCARILEELGARTELAGTPGIGSTIVIKFSVDPLEERKP